MIIQAARSSRAAVCYVVLLLCMLFVRAAARLMLSPIALVAATFAPRYARLYFELVTRSFDAPDRFPQLFREPSGRREQKDIRIKSRFVGCLSAQVFTEDGDLEHHPRAVAVIYFKGTNTPHC